MKNLSALIIAVSLPHAGLAFCNPPIAPAPTSEVLAREYREEFRQNFEQYFSDAQLYLRCLETERSEVMIEVNETAARYNRFLKDSQQWVQE